MALLHLKDPFRTIGEENGITSVSSRYDLSCGK